jgi:hypothetical protein
MIEWITNLISVVPVPKNSLRPTPKELAYIGFSELQILLISDLPEQTALDIYQGQLELLMSGSDETIDF